MHTFDIAIIGGGIVGLVQALSLQASGLRIALIDQQGITAMPHGEPQLRVSALTLASQQVLSALGAWQHMPSARMASYQGMQVWEQDSFGQIEFRATDVAKTQLGYIVENQAVQAALWQQVQHSDDITVFADTEIAKLSLSTPGSFIQLADETMLSARLVIGADGANSMVRSRANLPLTFWDYEQKAIVATVKTEFAHEHVARQIFTPSGPLAFLPLWHSNYCSIVWSQDNHQANALLQLPERQFNQALSAAFDMRLGLCEVISERQAYPLKMRYARQWLRDGVVIVGDAAHTVHPLAGQGANLGILDAAALAEQILNVHEQGKDFSLARHLRPYERWRKTEALKLVAAMEGFKRLFAGKQSIKQLLRDAGMSSVNHMPGLKQQLIKQAMGLSGELPALAISSSPTL